MGLAYYRVQPEVLGMLRPLIDAHEADILGPRARGYWFDYPDDYDYQGVRDTALKLDAAGQQQATARLELSEVEAHSLALLEVDVPHDSKPFPPALFLASAAPDEVRFHLQLARQALGDDPDLAVQRFSIRASDRRLAGYLRKQVRHLRGALPRLWKFYAGAAAAAEAVLIVDLRARDLYIPDPVETMALLFNE